MQKITKSIVSKLLPKRNNNAHKGECGRVVIIGGSSDMSGAVVLAANAAFRSGAGLVYVICPDCISQIVHISSTESIVRGIKTNIRYGTFKDNSIEPFMDIILKADVLVIGPGMGQNKSTKQLLNKLLKFSQNRKLKVILDADAINFSNKDMIKNQTVSFNPIILTPHAGEMARLIKKSISYIQKNRVEITQKTSKELNSIIILKGAYTVVSNPENDTFINTTGNCGMATAGSGDVLSGILSAFIAQGINPFDAAKLSVYVHGLAGDMAKKEKGVLGLIASDIIENIPKAILSLSKNRQ